LRPSSPTRRHLQAIKSGQLLLPFHVDAEASVSSASEELADEVPAVRPRRSSVKMLGPQDGDAREPRGPKRTQKNAKPKPPAQTVIPSEDKPPVSRNEPLDEVSFLRLPEVKAVTGLGKTSIYELIRDKSFPAPVRLGPRAVAWVRSEVRQWAAERVHASRSAA